jgi:hypothetical protein
MGTNLGTWFVKVNGDHGHVFEFSIVDMSIE